MPLVREAKLVIDDAATGTSSEVPARCIYREGKLDEIVLDPSQLKMRFQKVA